MQNEPKQVIVIRKDLNMRKGKMVAQGAHASLKPFFDRFQRVDASETTITYQITVGIEEAEWINGMFTKICVSVDSEQELLEIYAMALAMELPCALITDAGLTEFKVPTKTAVSVGPAHADKVNAITGHLKLL